MKWSRAAGALIACAAFWSYSHECCAQEQYPKPLIHTPTDHPAARILLLSIDGLHASDLALWVQGHPHSALAELTARGVTYTNAHTPVADPAAGLVSLATGGTPISTGIISSHGYDHALSPPGSHCKSLGAPLLLDDEGAPHPGTNPALNRALLPLDPRNGCAPLLPHNLLRVNTMFEVVHAKIGPTAWAGSNEAITDLLRGPSGQGLDQACNFAGTAATGDQARVSAVLHWIDAKNCTGEHDANVPALFGMSFLAIAEAQLTTGYQDALGTPSAPLAASLLATDHALSRIILELKARSLYDSTWIIVGSPFGQAPMDVRQRRLLPLDRIRQVANSVQPGVAAHVTGGDVAMIWLKDPPRTPAVAKAYSDQAAALGIQDVRWGAALALTLNPPAKDSRMPDIMLQSQPGVLWGAIGDPAVAGRGGMREEDTHVALLVSGAQLTGRFDPTLVPTTQLAPLLLRALGLEKFDLQALHLEHSPALPGIF